MSDLADRRSAYCHDYGHSWPAVPSMFSGVLIKDAQTDRCIQCGELRVIHADGSRTYIHIEDVSTNPDKETDMPNTTTMPISDLSRHYALPEMCDSLNSVLTHLTDETDVAPLNINLQNAINGIRAAIDNIDMAEQQMHTYSQTRADRPMIEAISKAIHKAFDNERNVGPANGMLADIAGSGDVILAAIRGAGYVISPEPPF